MSSYEDRFVKIAVVFLALCFENEVSEPPIFCISEKGDSLSRSDCSKSMKKICVHVVDVFSRERPKLTDNGQYFPVLLFTLLCTSVV